MAEQAGPRTLEGSGSTPEDSGSTGVATDAMLSHPPHGRPGEPEAFHGTRLSWIGVAVVILGFVVGGIALMAGAIWWLFWVGVAIAVAGLIEVAAVKTLDDWY